MANEEWDEIILGPEAAMLSDGELEKVIKVKLACKIMNWPEEMMTTSLAEYFCGMFGVLKACEEKCSVHREPFRIVVRSRK